MKNRPTIESMIFFFALWGAFYGIQRQFLNQTQQTLVVDEKNLTIPALEKKLRLTPRSEELRESLAQKYLLSGQPQKSLEEFERVQQIQREKLFKTLLNKAQAYLELKEGQNALQVLKSARDITKNKELLILEAKANLLLEKKELARKLFEESKKY
jgi:tetratricopeptide (TPR) repeat protein